jgi:predicted aspartyl protease
MEKLKIFIKEGLGFLDVEFFNTIDNDYYGVTVLLDTGASTTTVKEIVLKELNCLVTDETVEIGTAIGFGKARKAIISKIRIGAVEIADLNVYAHVFPKELPFGGILGMDILRMLKADINLEENIITLKQ